MKVLPSSILFTYMNISQFLELFTVWWWLRPTQCFKIEKLEISGTKKQKLTFKYSTKNDVPVVQLRGRSGA